MSTFYEQVGGEKFFADLVSQFYAVVATDPILRPMYPETDLQGAAQRLQWFLEQYWGGSKSRSCNKSKEGNDCCDPCRVKPSCLRHYGTRRNQTAVSVGKVWPVTGPLETKIWLLLGS